MFTINRVHDELEAFLVARPKELLVSNPETFSMDEEDVCLKSLLGFELAKVKLLGCGFNTMKSE